MTSFWTGETLKNIMCIEPADDHLGSTDEQLFSTRASVVHDQYVRAVCFSLYAFFKKTTPPGNHSRPGKIPYKQTHHDISFDINTFATCVSVSTICPDMA
jgi:hypothetical protein